jgi:carboxymethylenebutenolidase
MVATPFIFHWWPKSADIEVKRNEFATTGRSRLMAAYDLLAGMKNVRADRVGIVGIAGAGACRGSARCPTRSSPPAAIFYGGRIRASMGEGNPPAVDLAGNIKCPVMGFFGSLDENPSPEDVERGRRRRSRKAGVEHTFHRYEGANHAFQDSFGQRYHPQAAEDAWQKALAFFRCQAQEK